MKNFLITSFVLMSLALPSFAGVAGTPGYPQPAEIKTRLSRQTFQAVDLGVQVISKKKQLMKALYSFAVQGGASTLTSNVLKLKDTDGKDAVLPKNAIVTNVMVDVLTALTASATSGFTAPKLTLDWVSTGDLKASALYSTFSANAKLDGIPVETAATVVKNTIGASALTTTLTGGSVTAGKFNVFVEYYLSD